MISQCCHEIVGADIDTYFIAYCKSKWPKIKFLCFDITRDLPFHDDHFDVVVSVETLEHLSTMFPVKKALFNFHRVLKPGGTFVSSGTN